MYHHSEAERLLEIAALPADVPLSPELRAIGHALLAVADAIRDGGVPRPFGEPYRPEDDDPIPYRIEGRRLPTPNGRP
jgi:hypothetical protein